jgi:competence protein ComGC
MKTQPAFTHPALVAPPIRSSRREEAHSEFRVRNSEFRIGQSLLTSSATRFGSSRQFAFTRAELLVIVAVLALLTFVILPALANNQLRSARVVCANNLRQIGAAIQLWGNDHNDQPPWELAPDQGGTKLHSLGVNSWLHFSWVSNELNSARILLCPSDTGRLADDFSFSPTGGYLHPNFRNLATSYFLTHAFYGGQFVLLAGDRNLGSDGATSCSRFPRVTRLNLQPLSAALSWDTNLHNRAGNVVRLDGSVNQYSNDGLRAAVNAQPISDRGDLHILKPR